MRDRRPTFLDRVIAWASPERGLHRLRARAALASAPDLLKRYYDAARPSRQTYGWTAGFSSANTETWGSMAVLRARSRDLVRNNPHARKAIASLVNNCVGSGILMRAKTGDEALNKRVNALFKRWSKQCDVEGHYDFYGLQKLMARSFFEGGEAVALKRPRPRSAGLAVPLQLQVLEGDLIDHNKNLVLEDGRIVQGVESVLAGPRRAYWMFDEHPGDAPFINRGMFTAHPIPARQVIHLYEKERPGQQRGVAWLYAAMLVLRELATYEEAELIRKRLEACFAGVVTNPEAISDPATGETSVTPGITDLSGNKVESIEPGMLYYARGGSDIKFGQPANVAGYSEYKRSQLHSAAAGCLITYELMTGDLSHVNYSSIRAGLLEYRRLMTELQWLTFIPVALEPIWCEFIDFAVASGQLPQDTPYDVACAPPVFEAVDPLKDYTADQIAVRSGLMSLPAAIAARGEDPDELLLEQAAFLAKADKLGLVFDSDPRKTARTGAAQSAASDDQAPTDGAPASDDDRARAIHGVLTRAGLNGAATDLTRELMAELHRS
jgi:lambda family phage portal protein